MLWDSTSHVAPQSCTVVFIASTLLFRECLRPPAHCLLFHQTLTSTLLYGLPAYQPKLHLSSQHLVTGGSKAVMAKRLHDALHVHGAIDHQ